MPPVKPTDFSLLLEVFRDGLRVGVIAKEEIIAWADGIIMAEDEPDYFFIELSLCADTNRLFELLYDHIISSENIIPSRVLLGIVYQKLAGQQLKADKAISLLNSVNQDARLTRFESMGIYCLDDDYEDIMYQKDEAHWIKLIETIMVFLINYKDFALNNYQQWPEINDRVEEALNEEQVKNEMDYAANALRRQKKMVIQRRWIYGFVYLLALASLLAIITTYKPVGSHVSLSKFRSDLYQVAILYFYFFVGFWVLRGIYKVMGWKLLIKGPNHRRH